MAVVPDINIDRALHAISAKLNQTDREINWRLMRIADMDKDLREIWQLAVDVIASQIEAIEQLQKLEREGKLVPEKRIFHFEEIIDEKLAQIREDYLFNYESLLKARSAYMSDDGQRVSLTREKKDELFANFENRLEQKLTDYRNIFPINASVDLEKIRMSLQEIQGMKEGVYEELFDAKQELAEESEDLELSYKQLWDQRKKLFKEDLRVQDLYFASQVGDVEFIKHFGNLKQRVNELDPQGNFAPLHYAAYHNQKEAAKQLISKGKANPTIQDRWGNQPIHWAAKQGSYSVISYLMKLPSKLSMINAQGEYGRAPLHRSVFNGKGLTTELLLHEGADPNLRADGEGGITPLHVAVESNPAMVWVLLKDPRIDVTKGDSQGASPISRAVLLGLEDVATSLLNHPSALRLEQRMPELDALIGLAKDTKQKNILKILLLRDIDWKFKQKQANLDLEKLRELEDLELDLKNQKKSSEQRKQILSLKNQEISQANNLKMAEYQESLHQLMQAELDSLGSPLPFYVRSDATQAIRSIEEFGRKIFKGESSSSSASFVASSTSEDHLDSSKGKEEEKTSS